MCGNVACPDFPEDFDGVEHCCTADARCGVAYDPAYGASCIAREPEAPIDSDCDDEGAGIGFLFGFPTLDGCCIPNDEGGGGVCGLTAGVGAGCVTRENTWIAMRDGAARFFYSGPFEAQTCTP